MKKIIKKIFFISFFSQLSDLNRHSFRKRPVCSFSRLWSLSSPSVVTFPRTCSAFPSVVGSEFIQFILSQLSDLNRLPARYEGAALPGELSWRILKIILLRLFRILCQRCVLNLQCCLLLCNFQIFLVCVFLQVY